LGPLGRPTHHLRRDADPICSLAPCSNPNLADAACNVEAQLKLALAFAGRRLPYPTLPGWTIVCPTSSLESASPPLPVATPAQPPPHAATASNPTALPATHGPRCLTAAWACSWSPLACRASSPAARPPPAQLQLPAPPPPAWPWTHACQPLRHRRRQPQCQPWRRPWGPSWTVLSPAWPWERPTLPTLPRLPQPPLPRQPARPCPCPPQRSTRRPAAQPTRHAVGRVGWHGACSVVFTSMSMHHQEHPLQRPIPPLQNPNTYEHNHASGFLVFGVHGLERIPPSILTIFTSFDGPMIQKGLHDVHMCLRA
jgi:hypothetical protein